MKVLSPKAHREWEIEKLRKKLLEIYSKEGILPGPYHQPDTAIKHIERLKKLINESTKSQSIRRMEE